MTHPAVCVDENLRPVTAGLRLAPHSVPRLVVDIVGNSSADGGLSTTPNLPGKQMINIAQSWRNNAPLDQMVLIRITRGSRSWVTSNPNAIQFRDRWTYAIDSPAAVPLTTSIFNGQMGSAIDFGTNTVAEPNPGKQWMWMDAHCTEEWVGPVPSQSVLQVWYRAYVWTPPPWSDNANKNAPEHSAAAKYARMSLWAFPSQGNLVAG